MHVFCINLASRTDRLIESRIEFEKLNIEFERFNAIYHVEKGVGCALSHVKCLQLAKQNNYDCCMICEDDLLFTINKLNFQKLINNFLGQNANVLLLIGNNDSQRSSYHNYNNYFFKTTDSQTTTCYIIKNQYYDTLLKLFEWCVEMLLTSNSSRKYHEYCIDQAWKKLQRKDTWLIPKIYTGCQRVSYSDIEKIQVNYEPLFKELYNKLTYIIIKVKGGLGNQLFQVATGYARAKEQNNVCALIDNSEQNFHSNENYLTTIFRKFLMHNNNIANISVYNEKPNTALCYDPVINKNTNATTTLLNGYFQNEQYFIKYKWDIYSLFEIESERHHYLTSKYGNLNKSYFVHVRRGDYLDKSKQDYHYVNLDVYYSSIIKHLIAQNGNINFYIFSDDIQYCKSTNLFTDRCAFIENENETNSLYLMSLCNLGGICANSSFSWWGGYLNKNQHKKIYFPNKWFGFKSAEIINQIGFTKSILIDIYSGHETKKILKNDGSVSKNIPEYKYNKRTPQSQPTPQSPTKSRRSPLKTIMKSPNKLVNKSPIKTATKPPTQLPTRLPIRSIAKAIIKLPSRLSTKSTIRLPTKTLIRPSTKPQIKPIYRSNIIRYSSQINPMFRIKQIPKPPRTATMVIRQHGILRQIAR